MTFNNLDHRTIQQSCRLSESFSSLSPGTTRINFQSKHILCLDGATRSPGWRPIRTSNPHSRGHGQDSRLTLDRAATASIPFLCYTFVHNGLSLRFADPWLTASQPGGTLGSRCGLVNPPGWQPTEQVLLFGRIFGPRGWFSHRSRGHARCI